jgi:perosamine synthetase
MFTRLAKAGNRSIIPIEEYELLDEPARYPEARDLTRTTISLPIYPGLALSDVEAIAAVVREGL